MPVSVSRKSSLDHRLCFGIRYSSTSPVQLGLIWALVSVLGNPITRIDVGDVQCLRIMQLYVSLILCLILCTENVLRIRKRSCPDISLRIARIGFSRDDDLRHHIHIRKSADLLL